MYADELHFETSEMQQWPRTGTGTGNGGGTRTDSDDDGNPDEWAEGAYHLRRETRFGIGAQLARTALLWKMRQEIGMCALRGHAKFIISRKRMENIGGGGTAHFGADDDGTETG
ncbi:hypothetical protein T492DRAFT_864597 [Pavlovales sp. CCMP2436]|nr:hypothetical protein T492DRAFT_864597 [Pavlovales sp. CCMP2436]